MPKIKYGYVIGPFRADTRYEMLQNVIAAERLGRELIKYGVFPVIPHKNTENFHGLGTDGFWLQGTAGLMLRCDFAITVEAIGLPWKHSSGSIGEVVTAHDFNFPLFHSIPKMRAWLDGEPYVREGA